jgi:hypothetical protein
MDDKFLGLLCEKGVCYCSHGTEKKPPTLLSYSHSQKNLLWGNFVVNDKYIFRSVQKFRDEYGTCRFIFVWRRMVRAMELLEVT